MATPNTHSRVEEIVAEFEKKFAEIEADWNDDKKAYVYPLSQMSDWLRTTLTELEVETVPSSTFVEETKEAYHSGYLSGVAEKKRAVVAERERIIEVTTNSHKAFMVPQTIERWKAFITPKQTN